MIELTAAAFPFSMCLLEGPPEVHGPGQNYSTHTYIIIAVGQGGGGAAGKKLINIACAGRQQQRSTLERASALHDSIIMYSK